MVAKRCPRAPFTLILFTVLVGCALDGPDRQEQQAQDLASTPGWTCNGVTGQTQSPSGSYYVTSFGCWIDEDGKHRGDASDNCIPYCSGDKTAQEQYQALCPGMTGAQCERHLRWFAADSDRFGCMQRLKVTNSQTGEAVVVVVLDKGPACWVERKVDHWVLDLSYPASHYLFGESKSVTERGEVIVEEVPPSTPLGPWDSEAVEEPGSGGSGGDGGGGGQTWEDPSCVADGACTADDDCLCVECHSDDFCSDAGNCQDDGACDPYLEGCVCADCAAHPVCAGGASTSETEVVVDSNQSFNPPGARFTASSQWTSSGNVSGYFNTGYFWRSTGQTSDLARFELQLAGPETLTVQAWWPAASDRSPNAPFIIYDAEGTQLDVVYVNQQQSGSQWVTLGTYAFTAGWNSVALSRWTGAGYVVVADAVRFLTP